MNEVIKKYKINLSYYKIGAEMQKIKNVFARFTYKLAAVMLVAIVTSSACSNKKDNANSIEEQVDITANVEVAAINPVAEKAEPQSFDDFYAFFKEFKNDIQSNSGEILPKYFDDNYLKSIGKKGFKSKDKKEVCKIIKENYKIICKLSSENKYSVENKGYTDEYGNTYFTGCEIYYENERYKDYDPEYGKLIQKKYKSTSVYNLNYYSGSDAGSDFVTYNCIFILINAEWKIIDFYIKSDG